ncbi:MAG: response regulator [Acidithiobacillus sp.]
MTHILIVEDEEKITDFLAMTLRREGYTVAIANDLAKARAMLKAMSPRKGEAFDVVLLDMGLPDGDGLTLIPAIRARPGLLGPMILVLSARGEELEKIRALDAGADDYLCKPFAIGEFLARLRALLRRRDASTGGPAHGILHVGDLEIDRDHHRAMKRGSDLALTPIEYAMLVLLAERVGTVLTHKQFLDSIWGKAAHDQTHYVRFYIKRLREKIEDNPSAPTYIITETGIGYRLVSSP